MKEQFLELSAEIGANYLLVQGAGGNTSLKAEDQLLVKASGTWLSQAKDSPIFVTMTRRGLLTALDNQKEDCSGCLIEPSSLRPSIECLLHAVMPHRVVLHVHSVATLVHAIQTDGERNVACKLAGLNFAWVPYAKPGLPLAQWMVKNLKQLPDVLVLQNHGLVVGGESVDDAAALLTECERRLELQPQTLNSGDKTVQLEFAQRWGLKNPALQIVHSLSCAEEARDFLAAGVLYPDQAVFLGPTFVLAEADQDMTMVLAAAEQSWGTKPPCLIVSGVGVFLTNAARRGTEEMLLCHALILERLPHQVSYRPLSSEQILDLIDWDAEKYRQRMNS